MHYRTLNINLDPLGVFSFRVVSSVGRRPLVKRHWAPKSTACADADTAPGWHWRSGWSGRPAWCSSARARSAERPRSCRTPWPFARARERERRCAKSALEGRRQQWRLQPSGIGSYSNARGLETAGRPVHGRRGRSTLFTHTQSTNY